MVPVQGRVDVECWKGSCVNLEEVRTNTKGPKTALLLEGLTA